MTLAETASIDMYMEVTDLHYLAKWSLGLLISRCFCTPLMILHTSSDSGGAHLATQTLPSNLLQSHTRPAMGSWLGRNRLGWVATLVMICKPQAID